MAIVAVSIAVADGRGGAGPGSGDGGMAAAIVNTAGMATLIQVPAKATAPQ